MKRFNVGKLSGLAMGLIFSGMIVMSVSITSQELQANTCKKACNKFVSCSVDFWKKQGKIIPRKDKKKAKLGCMKTCKQNKRKVLSCYKTSKNQCMKYWTCVKKHYKK